MFGRFTVFDDAYIFKNESVWGKIFIYFGSKATILQATILRSTLRAHPSSPHTHTHTRRLAFFMFFLMVRACVRVTLVRKSVCIEFTHTEEIACQYHILPPNTTFSSSNMLCSCTKHKGNVYISSFIFTKRCECNVP